ncbi:putative MFS family arabinose efflux permease [Paraburkholderia sp. GAS448]|uniref:MFS transporter n=1 Tax=Paraburkholderia sp. GAS448 TaxID=3035136 RepID=UPI003D23E217
MNWKNRPGAVLATLLTIQLLGQIDRNMLLGFSPQITRDLALSNAQYGLLGGAVWVLSYGVMSVLMGTLADRFSRPRLIAVGLLIWSVCTVASGTAHTFGQMVAARFLVASGEAALIPAAVALLYEVFAPQRRSAAIGLFFMGIPLGIGCSFLLAGTFGAEHGWRTTFFALGAIGMAIAVPLSMLREHRGGQPQDARGEPFVAQVGAVVALLRGNQTIVLTIIGFVLVHMVAAGFSFAQLWLVRERGFDGAGIARTIGVLMIVFGTLGSVAGGALGDRYARRLPGGLATFMLILVLLAAPLMIAYRLAPAGSPMFYAGMCAGFFLPLALYGPAITVIQSLTPPQMRSTITGCSMLLINVVAFAIGSFAIGSVSDALARAGVSAPLTKVLLGADIVAIASALFFLMAAMRLCSKAPAPQGAGEAALP